LIDVNGTAVGFVECSDARVVTVMLVNCAPEEGMREKRVKTPAAARGASMVGGGRVVARRSKREFKKR